MSVATDDYLQIRHLSKSYGDSWALKDVSLNIAKDEFVCFLGPSGCGKTTLLRMVAGLETQTSGTIHQNGVDISDLPVSERDFGIVFQSYALFPNLTVEANIAFGLVNQRLKRTEIDRKVNDLLNLVGLALAHAKYPSELSGGMQQRVALARALALSPGLLLLDEPLSALDARVRSHLRSEIRKLHSRLGITTIMVTHDQEEALTMADRIVVMNEGKIEQVGTPQQIYSFPQTPFVANFVGTSNRIVGKVCSPHTVTWGDGQTLACDLPLTAVVGQSVHLVVRPEHVRITNERSGDNTLLSAVHGIEFLGSYCRLSLHLSADTPALLADLSSEQVGQMQLTIGRSLFIQIPRERIQVFEGRA